jgi:glucose-1-phosphate thymidylyltransferase
MNVLILAAGYATRLYPLTQNKAKPLLEIAGKPMIERLMDHLVPVPDIETVFIVTNAKFAHDFEEWANDYQKRRPKFAFQIINDGSKSDEDKLGAIGDINLVVAREKLAANELLVVAGDNLFSQSLADFVDFAQTTKATVAVYDVGSLETIKKYGCVTVDSDGVVTSFEEKPQEPKSTLCAIALYYYSPELLPRFATYLEEGNNPDQPGRFLQWLYTRKSINTFQIKGLWLDIGSKETLQEANKIFAKIET